MKLNCELVKDLYPLYKENDLSPSVKQEVEAHLERCENCKSVYESETGFDDIFAKDEKKFQPSDKLDDKIRLKMKLRRLRIFVTSLIVFFLMYGYFQYVDNRKTLLYEISSVEIALNQLNFSVERAKGSVNSHGSVIESIELFNDRNNRIVRNLNFLEERARKNHEGQFHLFFNLKDFINVINLKYGTEFWTDKDEKAYETMVTYFDQYQRLLTDEHLTLDGVQQRAFSIKALITPIAISEMMDLQLKINQLAYTYERFQKLPNEVEILSRKQIAQEIKEQLMLEKGEVSFQFDQSPELIKSIGRYTFNVKGYHGTVDAYTGKINEINYHLETKEGKLLDEETLSKQLNNYLDNLYTPDFDFSISDMGINYHYTSNVDHQLNTYHVSPIYLGYRVKEKIRVHMDARTAKLSSIISLEEPRFNPALDFKESPITISQEEGLEKIKQDEFTNIKFIETLWQPSDKSGMYELFHKYSTNDEQSVYVNAFDGTIEKAAKY